MHESIARKQLRVDGVVQGVGFRPFVHRLAASLGLTGTVGNDTGGVTIDVAGPPGVVAEFRRRLHAEAPPLSRIDQVREEPADGNPPSADGFRIIASDSARHGGRMTTPPPDTATCEACLTELADPTDRRHRHPFISCTDCGPRFTIIQRLPYDRPATTMAVFPLCPSCQTEYDDPTDRRFHAQPVACHDCGPGLWWRDAGGATVGGRGRVHGDAAIAAAQQALIDGAIVAVKGIGGYHLACRADDDDALARLRERKQRPGKPFALLAHSLDVVRRVARVDAREAAALTSPAAPIVLLHRRGADEVARDGPGEDAGGAAGAAAREDGTGPISRLIAPGNPLLGVMVASNPVHRLLLDSVPGTDLVPLDMVVLTSGNLSEEPICTDDDDAAQRLGHIADGFLLHDRPIAVPCDDSVVRVLDDAPVVLRRSRGYVPMSVRLPVTGQTALGLGGELKSTVCLTDGTQAWLSQHIGDMGSLPALRAFERTVERTQTLFDVQPQVLACDAHPDHIAHGWARRHADGRDVVTVQHHHAHTAAAMVEHGLSGPVLGVVFDGTGFGRDRHGDAQIWGGEVLLADLASARRLAHLSLTSLPGGDAAIRHPRRVALAHLLTAGIDFDDDLAPVTATDPDERTVLRQQIERGINTVPTSSAGRLFDAVSSLLDIRHDITYEAQAAIELEIVALRHQQAGAAPTPLVLPVIPGDEEQPAILDAAALIRQVVAAHRDGQAVGAIALGFHVALAEAVAEVSALLGDRHGVADVCLSGGVFANALLLHMVDVRIRGVGMHPRRHRLIPPNDGGLALGQAAIAAARRRSEPCA